MTQTKKDIERTIKVLELTKYNINTTKEDNYSNDWHEGYNCAIDDAMHIIDAEINILNKRIEIGCYQ